MTRRVSGRGAVLLFTGDGKGKTSAAIGTAVRLAGRGRRVLVLLFAKPPGGSGEEFALRKLAPRVVVKALGRDWLDLSAEPRQEKDLGDVARQWKRALALIAKGRYDAVVLDEANFLVSAGFLPAVEVAAFLDSRPNGQDVIITGSGADPEIVRRADYVTEMKKLKHPFDKGILAARGIDY